MTDDSATAAAVIGLSLALATALAWSILDALRKHLGRLLSAILVAGALSTGGILPFFVLLLDAPPRSDLPAGLWPVLLGSAILNIAANILFLRAVQVSPLSLTIPYLSFTPVFVLLGGALFLGQLPTLLSGVGLGLVVGGAVLLNPRIDGQRFHPLEALRRERGSLYMLAVAGLWSIATVLDRMGVLYVGLELYSVLVNALCGLPLLAWAAVRSPEEVARLRRQTPLLTVAVLVLALAMYTQFTAWDYLFVAYTDAVKRGAGMVFSTLLGFLFFGERQLRQRLPAVLVMALGVALVLIGRA